MNDEHRGTRSRDCVFNCSASRLDHETSGIQPSQRRFFPSPETHIHGLIEIHLSKPENKSSPLAPWRRAVVHGLTLPATTGSAARRAAESRVI